MELYQRVCLPFRGSKRDRSERKTCRKEDKKGCGYQMKRDEQGVSTSSGAHAITVAGRPDFKGMSLVG